MIKMTTEERHLMKLFSQVQLKTTEMTQITSCDY